MSLGCVLSLGSNLGDRLAQLQVGLVVLRSRLGVTAISPVYETEPVGGPPQPAYLNAIVLARTPDPPTALAAAQAAEAAAGRTREGRWGPRSLDVDVIAVGAVVDDNPRLTLPHPSAHERAFVLMPWYDVDPTAALPTYGPVLALLDAAGHPGVVRRDDLVLS